MALEIRPADEMKIAIIKYLSSKYPDIIFGNEVMYGTTRKVVDLLALYKGETYAIEVKSEKDDMRRLPEQIKEYSLIFDHTAIYTHPKHLNSVLSCAPSRVSVYEVVNDVITVIRHSEEQNRTTKQEMLYSISANYIKKKLQLSADIDSDLIRARVIRNYKKDAVHALLFEFYQERLSNSYNIIKANKINSLSIDDLSILSARLNL